MDCKDLHFEILSLVLKVIHNSWYYCFSINILVAKIALAQIAVDFNDIERICDFAQFKFDELSKIGDRLKPYVKEAEDCSNDDIKQLFGKSDEFCFSYRDSYTSYRHEYPLSKWIKSLSETKKTMGEQNDFKITLLNVIFCFSKLKVKKWLTISLPLKRNFLNLIMS